MNADEFLTLAGPGTAQTRVLGSRFLGTSQPVRDLEDVAVRLEEERKRYHDATHWCWAARIGVGKRLIEKSTDAGEPHGTAGLPILRELQKRDLTDCLVIITRYFGGTKLGTGGLARAYGECAGLALDAAPVLRVAILAQCRARCSYDEQGLVYAIARRFACSVEAAADGAQASFVVRGKPDRIPELAAALREESRGKIQVEVSEWS